MPNLSFRLLILFTFLSGYVAVLTAAKPELIWDIDFSSAFDNREGDATYVRDMTWFFVNLAPEVGLQFSKHDRIAGGVVYNQPIGREWDGARFSPTFYYRHTSRRWDLSMGMFPRKQLQQQLPGFLWCDSLNYFQKNIRGVLVQYHDRHWIADLYLDWRQMQTETKREAFNIVAHASWRDTRSPMLAGAHVMMNHYALTHNAPADQHIVDNFLINPYIGLDLSHRTPLDSLNIRLGAVATIERNRARDNWDTPVGVWLELTAEWRWLGLRNTLYAGGRLLPSWPEFGSRLYPGEPFYQARFYDRLDIYARILSTRYVNLEADLNFNFATGSFIFYQRLLLDVNIGNLTGPHR